MDRMLVQTTYLDLKFNLTNCNKNDTTHPSTITEAKMCPNGKAQTKEYSIYIA